MTAIDRAPSADLADSDAELIEKPIKGKYRPLFLYFAGRSRSDGTFRLTFREIDQILGGDGLPKSAHDYDAWWYGSGTQRPHTRAWRRFGWRASTSRSGETVTFTPPRP